MKKKVDWCSGDTPIDVQGEACLAAKRTFPYNF